MCERRCRSLHCGVSEHLHRHGVESDSQSNWWQPAWSSHFIDRGISHKRRKKAFLCLLWLIPLLLHTPAIVLNLCRRIHVNRVTRRRTAHSPTFSKSLKAQAARRLKIKKKGNPGGRGEVGRLAHRGLAARLSAYPATSFWSITAENPKASFRPRISRTRTAISL